MSLYIPKMSDTPGVAIPGLASNFQALDGSQIVEWGSNENGEYVRWENGLQFCWNYYSGWGALERNKEDEVWVFPAAFESIPRVVGFPYSFNRAPVLFWIRRTGSDGNLIPFNGSQVPISRYRISGVNNYEGVHLLAIGWWK